ncbi:MAG TPA: hypothetical protein VFB01_14775 [Burkholderiales bacterium]|nr:hypothetical protein [Burkholderiales bacterium]
MLNRKIAIMLVSGAALAVQAGFAAADETDADFWSKNPRNGQLVNQPSAPEAGTRAQSVSPAPAPAAQTRGPATNPVDQFYYRQSGGVPAA